MEIIGKTDKRGYIVTISGDELANLVGYYSENQTPNPNDSYTRRGPFNVGDTITVGKMYYQLYNLSRISSEAEQAKKCLQAAIELFTVIDPVVRKIVEEPTAEVQS